MDNRNHLEPLGSDVRIIETGAWRRRIKLYNKQRCDWENDMMINVDWAAEAAQTAKSHLETRGLSTRKSHHQQRHKNIKSELNEDESKKDTLLNLGAQSHHYRGLYKLADLQTQQSTTPKLLQGKQMVMYDDRKRSIAERLRIEKTRPTPWLTKKLFQFFRDWDNASGAGRDAMVNEFIDRCTWRTPLDMDNLFVMGGPLIFSRFTVGLQMALIKLRRVNHYFDALSIFIDSIQGGEYTADFLSMGGITHCFEAVRISETNSTEKVAALNFLCKILNGMHSEKAKQFISDNPHFIESMTDFLTMCKNRKVLDLCKNFFNLICWGNKPEFLMHMTKLMLNMLTCDFNPRVQNLAFNVFHPIIREIPQIARPVTKCIIDNLKICDPALIIDMSEVGLVILDTTEADFLLKELCTVASGSEINENVVTWELSQRHRTKSHKQTREPKQKQDPTMTQTGAILVCTNMLSTQPKTVSQFMKHGILGISFLALGSAPNSDTQNAGIRLMTLLNDISRDCALSYRCMLPRQMFLQIYNRSIDALKHINSATCIQLRKLGRFAIQNWDGIRDEVFNEIVEYQHDQHIEFSLTGLGLEIGEFQKTLQHLMENPIMECKHIKSDECKDPLPLEPSAPSELEFELDNILSSTNTKFDKEVGMKIVMKDTRLEAFRPYLESGEIFLEEDDDIDNEDDMILHQQMKESKGDPRLKSMQRPQFGATEQAVLQDAEKAVNELKLKEKSTIATLLSESDAGSEAISEYVSAMTVAK